MEYVLPRIYLGIDEEARKLSEDVETAVKLNPGLFASRNRFVIHCLLFTLKHDKRIVKKPL